MHLVDEIFSEIKSVGYLRELRRCPLKERGEMLDKMVKKSNVFKDEISSLSSDEQLYLDFKVQEKGIDMGLCPDFYIFFSKNNDKFHHACKALDKQKTHCKGKDKTKCLLNDKER